MLIQISVRLRFADPVVGHSGPGRGGEERYVQHALNASGKPTKRWPASASAPIPPTRMLPDWPPIASAATKRAFGRKAGPHDYPYPNGTIFCCARNTSWFFNAELRLMNWRC